MDSHVWTVSDVIRVIDSLYGPVIAFYCVIIPIRVVKKVFSGM